MKVQNYIFLLSILFCSLFHTIAHGEKTEPKDRIIHSVGINQGQALENKISLDDSQAKTLYVRVTELEPPQLCDPTKKILAKLHQPIQMELYFAKHITTSKPELHVFNDYYESVYQLLREYVAASRGMIELSVIDPEPYSEAEAAAIFLGLKKFPVSEEHNFFFGLVIRTQYGIEKVIPFLSPNRRDLLEYDITLLIDNAIMPVKRRIGILSSLPVMGDDVSGYMAEMMRRQGQQPRPPWTIIEQLRKQYEIIEIDRNTEEIGDIDLLLIIHPKRLSKRTLFAIDQFALKGGRIIICVDPYCFSDRPNQPLSQTAAQQSRNSELGTLLQAWGLEMPANTFAGDRNLASLASVRAKEKPEKIIGYLSLVPERECFATENVITWELNQVRLLFSGVLKEIADSNAADKGRTEIKRTPLIMTSSKGNSFSIRNLYELMFLDASALMGKFSDGSKPVAMGYLITGRPKSSFPDGIEIEILAREDGSSEESKNTPEGKMIKRRITGLKEAQGTCAIVVFADVDFISDAIAYQSTFFGKSVVGDNSNLLLNATNSLLGSKEKIDMLDCAIRRQPRDFISEIRHRIESEYERELNTQKNVNRRAEIESLQNELKNLLSSAKEEEYKSIGTGDSLLSKKAELEKKILRAEKPFRRLKRERYEQYEQLHKLAKTIREFNIPASLVNEISIEDLESIVMATGLNAVQLKRKGGGVIAIVKEPSQKALDNDSHPTKEKKPVAINEFVAGPLLQGLDTSKIGYIKIGINNDSIIIKRIDKHFTVASKENYPAKLSVMNKLISSSLGIMVVERVTDNPEIQRPFGVTEHNAKTIVRFLKPDMTLLIGYMIGEYDQQRQGYYVRLLPGDNVFIVREMPSIEKDFLCYIDRDLLTIRKEDIESVTVVSAQEEYTIIPQQDGPYIIQEGQHDGKKTRKLERERAFQALCNLRIEDVIKSDEVVVKSDFSHKYICRMKDSTEYVCLLSQKNDEFYITIDSNFTDTTPVEKATLDQGGEVESEEELKKKEAKLLARDHATKFSQKHKGWIYRIPEESGMYMIQKPYRRETKAVNSGMLRNVFNAWTVFDFTQGEAVASNVQTEKELETLHEMGLPGDILYMVQGDTKVIIGSKDREDRVAYIEDVTSFRHIDDSTLAQANFTDLQLAIEGGIYCIRCRSEGNRALVRILSLGQDAMSFEYCVLESSH